MRERVVLVLKPSPEVTAETLVRAATRRGFRAFAVAPTEEVALPPGAERFEAEPDGIRASTRGGSRVPIAEIDSPERLTEAIGSAEEGVPIAVRWRGDRLIPLENLVAHRRGRSPIWVVLDDPREIPGALGALEHGADRVFVSFRTPELLAELETQIDDSELPPLVWQEAPLVRVRSGGMGDRVIVDTTSLLSPEEGMLVGSSAAFLLHVASEAEGSAFTRARPFRVNAGAAHSYVLMADGSTRYLAELGPGDQVLVAAVGGNGRCVRVGRIKIERRPLVELSVRRDERTFTLFLQEAETVRISSAGRSRVPTTALEAGIGAWGVDLPEARHLGTVVSEQIEER